MRPALPAVVLTAMILTLSHPAVPQAQRSDSPVVIRHAHRYTISGVAFTPDGSRLISTDIGGVIKIWEMPTVRLLRTLNHAGQFVGDLLVIAGGNALVTAGWGTDQYPDGFYDGSESAEVVIRLFGGGMAASSDGRILERRSPDAVRAGLRRNSEPR
ncbi:MAG TPA: hypothetical protein VGF24_22520 [Vicinamibacterales bacterium]